MSHSYFTFILEMQENTVSLCPSQQWYFTSCQSEMVFLYWCEMFFHYWYGESMLHYCSNLRFFDCKWDLTSLYMFTITCVSSSMNSLFISFAHVSIGWLIDFFLLIDKECFKYYGFWSRQLQGHHSHCSLHEWLPLVVCSVQLTQSYLAVLSLLFVMNYVNILSLICLLSFKIACVIFIIANLFF